MNSIFVLMIVTSTGVVEAPNSFSTFSECQKVSERIAFNSYCVEKKPVNVEGEMSKFIAMFKKLQKEMEQ